MSDHDDLLADADGFHKEQYPPHVHALVADLAAALRAALAARPQPLSLAEHGEQTVMERDFYRCPITSEWVYRWADERVVGAVVGSATPTGNDDE